MNKFTRNNSISGWFIINYNKPSRAKALLLALAVFTISGVNAQEDTTSRNLNEVVVTGQFKPQSLKNSVYKVRVIDQKRIAQRAATDLCGVLNTELGVRFSTDYTLGETDMQIMGMSGQNVKVLLDGVPLVDRGSTKQALSQIDINNVERIELVEGPMSVVYGTDALAGVVNIITKKYNGNRYENNLEVKARIQEETVGNKYSPFSKDGVHNEYVGVNWQHKSGIDAGASFSRNDFGGWKGTRTGRENEWKPKLQYLASGKIGYRTKNLSAWYRLDYLNEEILGNGKIGSDNKAADTAYVTDRMTHTAQADWRLSDKLSINTSASYQHYERRSKNTIMDFNNGMEYLNPSASQDVSVFKMYFLRSTAQYELTSKILLQPGLEIKSDQSSGQRILGNPSINDYSFFLSAEIKSVNKLNIRPAVRISKNSVYDAPPVIPSLNLKYDLSNDWSLRAAYAKGFRAPALRELYFVFHDASHDIVGNPDLKAEHSNSFNASITWNRSIEKKLDVSSSVSGFYNDFRDRIAYAQHATNPSWTTLINIDKYKTTGVVWENTASWKGLYAALGLSYIGRMNSLKGDAVIDKDNELEEFLWSPEVNANITYSITKLGLSLGLFYKYTGSVPGYQSAVVNNQTVLQSTKIEGFNMADFTVTKSIGKLLSINAGVKNIFDITRLSSSASDSGGGHSTGGPILTSYGRSYFVGLLFNWKQKTKNLK